jgi:hypothetical protein
MFHSNLRFLVIYYVGFVACYHPCMRNRRIWVLAAALFATACLGQEPAPAFRYNLQGTAGDVNRKITALTPDNDLLVLLSLNDDQWILKRVTGWKTNAPHEDTLSLDGRIPGEKGHADDASLTVSSTGDILAVRFCFHRINWEELHGSTGGPGPDAVVILIDLRRFTVISRRVTTDPILAAALWHFNKEGELIASGLEKSGYQPGLPPQSQRDGRTYAAEVLKVPDLQPRAACTFAELSRLSKESWPEFTERMKRADGGCAVVLEAGGASTLKDLESRGFEAQRFRVARRVNADAAARADLKDDHRYDPEQHCMFIDVSQGDRFANYHCEFSGLWKDFYNAIEVFSVADGKRVFLLHVPLNRPVGSMLATSQGQDFLLLLREGTTLEAYRLK